MSVLLGLFFFEQHNDTLSTDLWRDVGRCLCCRVSSLLSVCGGCIMDPSGDRFRPMANKRPNEIMHRRLGSEFIRPMASPPVKQAISPPILEKITATTGLRHRWAGVCSCSRRSDHASRSLTPHRDSAIPPGWGSFLLARDGSARRIHLFLHLVMCMGKTLSRQVHV